MSSEFMSVERDEADRDIAKAQQQIAILTERLRHIESRLNRALAKKQYHMVESFQMQQIAIKGVREAYQQYIIKKWEVLATIEFHRLSL